MPSVDFALRPAKVESAAARAAGGCGVEVARIEIFEDFAAAAPAWDALAGGLPGGPRGP